MKKSKRTIVYLIARRFPTERGHGIQIASMIDAFRNIPELNVLVLGTIPQVIKGQDSASYLSSYYGLKKPFLFQKLFWIPRNSLPILGGIVSWLNVVLVVAQTFYNTKPEDCIYTRDEVVGLMLSKLGRNVFLELHYEPDKTHWLFGHLYQNLRGVITNTQAATIRYKKAYPGISVIGIENGFDESWLSVKTKNQKKSTHRITLGYWGNLYEWKGVDTLLGALEILGDAYQAIIVGGSNKEHQLFQKQFPDAKVAFSPHQSRTQLQKIVKNMDILVLPFTAKNSHSAEYTSPLKLYEYLATRKFVVVSSTKSLQAVLPKKLVTWFTPDSSRDLAKKIRSYHPVSKEIQAQRRRYLADKTWIHRAQKISNYIIATCSRL